jgi:hypothetical protein
MCSLDSLCSLCSFNSLDAWLSRSWWIGLNGESIIVVPSCRVFSGGAGAAREPSSKAGYVPCRYGYAGGFVRAFMLKSTRVRTGEPVS